MRGTLVLARAYGGAALARRVWEVADGLVYLSSEAEFAKLEAGQEGLPPIGFPAQDVFIYDAAIAEANGKPKWDRLTQWKPYKVVRAS
jgi:hypothetical protein